MRQGEDEDGDDEDDPEDAGQPISQKRNGKSAAAIAPPSGATIVTDLGGPPLAFTAPDPRPIVVAPARPGDPGDVTLTVGQLLINQRISQAAIRRLNALKARMDGGLTGGDVDDGTLTVVIAGGGPTGVELAGAMAELFTKVLARDYKTLDMRHAQVVLVELSDHLLHGFHAASQEEARRELRLRGVDVRLGVGIASVEADKVTLVDGSVIPTRLVVWAAGVKASPLGRALGLELDRTGRVVVVGGPQVRQRCHPVVGSGELAHVGIVRRVDPVVLVADHERNRDVVHLTKRLVHVDVGPGSDRAAAVATGEPVAEEVDVRIGEREHDLLECHLLRGLTPRR